MKLGIVTAGACSLALLAGLTSASRADGLVGTVSLMPASGACAASADAGAIDIHVVLPHALAAGGRPVNRFRYNYREAAAVPTATPRLAISGAIEDFGVPGCTMTFAGLAQRAD